MRDEFYKVSGDVRFGNLGSKQAGQFRHQIAMNTEGKFSPFEKLLSHI